jgi:hypothetical protein
MYIYEKVAVVINYFITSHFDKTKSTKIINTGKNFVTQGSVVGSILLDKMSVGFLFKLSYLA